MRFIPFLLAVVGLPALADQLPVSCGGVGAESYTPSPVTIPAVTLNRGTVITVTNSTSAVNGDTSSVKALMANPGPDGISLNEAVTATNNDPGTWVIQFAPALKGSTIVGGIPYLIGGNVTINGDIDGNGQPGITLAGEPNRPMTIFIISGGNTVNGLVLQNCAGQCVGIQRPSGKFQLPPATGATFSNITISNLTMTDFTEAGIELFPVSGEPGLTPTSPAATTGNTWDHLRIIGNTISSTASGALLPIALRLGGTVGDTMQHTIVANNNLAVSTQMSNAIVMAIGNGLGSNNNQALDTLIANNTIDVSDLANSAIRISTGLGSGSDNLVDGLRIVSNQILSSAAAGSPGPYAIEIVNADAASDDANVDPQLLPIQYSEGNIARNISILSNTITGKPSAGIWVQEACCGNRNNVLENLSILGNTMSGVSGVGIWLVGGATGGAFSRSTSANALSNVLVQANTIHMTPAIYNLCNCYLPWLALPGGIQVVAGFTEPGNRVDALSIANNEIDTPTLGIGLLGGLGAGQGPFSADNNILSGAQIFCNQLDQVATVAVDPYQGTTGINVTAGVDLASGNQVSQLYITDNLIGGVLSAATTPAYLGTGGSGNTISMSPASAPWPQFMPPGLVNAATFQQDGLVPGSLFTLFGLNLNGADVQFDKISATVLYTSSSQLNLQVPWELQGESTTSVTVAANSITSPPQEFPVGSSDPGIFSLGAPQGGQGAIVNLAGVVVDANSPAHAGDYLEIYSTGLGAVTNQPQTGAAAVASPLSYLIGNLVVTIGGVPASVIPFAGLAPGFVGLYQVNVQVPQGVAAGDAVPVLLSIGPMVSNTVVISVR